MRKGFQNVFELTAASGILLSVATVALLTMSNSKGTGFIGEDVLDAYKSKGVVAAFQTAGHEIGPVIAAPLVDIKDSTLGVFHKAKGICFNGPFSQKMKETYDALAAPYRMAKNYQKMMDELNEQGRLLLQAQATELEKEPFGPIQMKGTRKIIHLEPSEKGKKRKVFPAGTSPKAP